MKFSRPVVMIFGAGATRGGLEGKEGPPPPVDTDFFAIANQLRGHGTPGFVRRVLKTVWDLYGRINGVSLERYYRDIETRAMIGKFAKTANQPKNWNKRRQDLEELIRRVYIHTTCNTNKQPTEPRKSETHQKILGCLKKGDTIITFNYDLLIEESFETGRIWTPVDGYGADVQGKTHDWCRIWLKNRENKKPSESKIRLLKLHGSLNWVLYRNRAIRLKPRPYAVGSGRIEKISVLPPGWNKRVDRNPYKLFWREARLRLEKCKTLIILGYSLPETDLLAQALFAEVVRTRVARKIYLKQLHIAEPNDSVKERFITLFTPALHFGGSLFKYRDLREFSDSRFKTGDS